jgi:hypothetical protein
MELGKTLGDEAVYAPANRILFQANVTRVCSVYLRYSSLRRAACRRLVMTVPNRRITAMAFAQFGHITT